MLLEAKKDLLDASSEAGKKVRFTKISIYIKESFNIKVKFTKKNLHKGERIFHKGKI